MTCLKTCQVSARALPNTRAVGCGIKVFANTPERRCKSERDHRSASKPKALTLQTTWKTQTDRWMLHGTTGKPEVLRFNNALNGSSGNQTDSGLEKKCIVTRMLPGFYVIPWETGELHRVLHSSTILISIILEYIILNILYIQCWRISSGRERESHWRTHQDVRCYVLIFRVFCLSLSLPRFLVHVFNHCMPPLRSLEDLGEGEMQALGLKELPVRGGACVAMWCVVLIQNALELQDGVEGFHSW